MRHTDRRRVRVFLHARSTSWFGYFVKICYSASTFAHYYVANVTAQSCVSTREPMFTERTSMLSKRQKANVMKDVQRHDGDTGSPEAQVALLTKRINELSAHLKKNAKDFHSRRGLLQMVADRRKHLQYLARKDASAYQALIAKLGLKK